MAGHVHEAPFKEDGSWVDRIGTTWVLNAGYQIGTIPAPIELDLKADTAQWISMMGDEEVVLASDRVPPRTVFKFRSAVTGPPAPVLPDVQYGGSGSRAEPGQAVG